MDSLYRVELRLRDIVEREKALENSLIERLEANDRKGAADVERDIYAIRREKEDELTLLDYYRQQGQLQSNTDLFVLHFRSVRLPAARSDDELNEAVMRWSESNARRDVTGLLVATPTAFFGTLEGPKAAVEQTYALLRTDSGHTQCHIMSATRAESRSYRVGLKLAIVEDENIARTMQELQHRIGYAERFAPDRVLDVVTRGGDALSLAPLAMPNAFVVAIMLDTLCGAVHKAARSMSTAARAVEIARPLGGSVVQTLGEVMLIVFPKLATATPAMTAVKRLVEELPYVVVAACCGDVTLASTPKCGAVGPGLRDAKKLVLLAENQRRPLIVTTEVQECCSHAYHKFGTFTIDNILYYTLASVGDRRLEVPPAPVVINAYVGLEPVDRTRENAIDFKPATAADLQEKRRHEAIVAGAVTERVLMEQFRKLDLGNCGWVSKQKFRQHIADSSICPIFEHDLARLDGWMERCNSLGDNRISFHEYCMLMLKLQQQ